MINFTKIKQLLEKANNIAIFVHTSPDGDCLGSAKAMQEYLKSQGKTADIFSTDAIPDYLKFLNIENMMDKNTISYDLSLALDCSDSKRMGRGINLFFKSKTQICIDHHTDYTEFCKFSMNNPKASSTGLIIYKFLRYCKFDFTNEICEALYTAISCDTGGFIHSNTTSDDHKAVAYLMDNSTVDFENLNFNLFKTKSLVSIKVLQRALTNMKFYCNDKLLVTYLTIEDLKACNAIEDDTSGISGFMNGIAEIKCAIIMLQREEEFRVSIRSKDDYAHRIALNFGGGGHPQAAGCRVQGKLEDALDILVKTAEGILC